MRRSGSAAPHSSWSPTVNADRYSGPIFSLRRRPTGVFSVLVTAAGVARVLSLAVVRDHAHSSRCASPASARFPAATRLFQLSR